MDFSKFNERKKAEAGEWFDIMPPNPEQGDQIVDEKGNVSRVKLRGLNSDSVIAAYKQIDKRAPKTPEAMAKTTLDDAHKLNISKALPLILEFENVEMDGAPIDVDDESAVRKLLNHTFPIVKMGKNDAGEPELVEVNRPFAKQFIENAGNHAAMMGNDEPI